MITTTLEQFLSDENINSAIDYLNSKNERVGSDGIGLSELRRFWPLNRERISEALRAGTFECNFIKEKEILHHTGKRRKIYLMDALDRLVVRAVLQCVQAEAEDLLHESCVAYRPNRGVNTAIERCQSWIREGMAVVVAIDIQEFFESIPHDRLQACLETYFSDKLLQACIWSFVSCRIQSEQRSWKKTKGLVTGNALSPLLSNLFLSKLDECLASEYVHYWRYGDDLNIFLKDYDRAYEIYEAIGERLFRDFGLRVNRSKSGIFSAFQRRILGYEFFKDSLGEIGIRKYAPRQPRYYSNWHESSLEKIGKDFHIVQDGILTKRDATILFENEQGKKYLPVEISEGLNIYGNVIFDSGLFEYLAQNGLLVNLFNRYGYMIGRFVPDGHIKSGKTLLKQTALYLDAKQRFRLAKAIEMAAVHNMRANLRYYVQKRESILLTESIANLSEAIIRLNESTQQEELMTTEARAREVYYRCFDDIKIVEGFRFEKRSKRPPLNSINTLISFGNTVLYNKIAQEIYKTTLDIRVSFVHATNNRKASLNLDLADLFKPIIVDRAIFSMINRREIDEQRDFIKLQPNGVYLSAEGKRKFLAVLEQKLRQTLSVGGRQMSYLDLIREEVRKIQRLVLSGQEYKPYKYIN